MSARTYGFAIAAATLMLGSAQAAPVLEGNFTAQDCARGGGYQYCQSGTIDAQNGPGGGARSGVQPGIWAPAPLAGQSAYQPDFGAVPGGAPLLGEGNSDASVQSETGSVVHAGKTPVSPTPGTDLPPGDNTGDGGPTLPQAVPEPGALALFAAALAGLLTAGWRIRRAA